MAWYPGWTFRKKITIDRTKVGGSLTNFPVLVSLGSDAQLAANARADGFDILFTDTDKITKLDHDRVNFIKATGELVAWVRIPTLTNTVNKEIYMYYGKADATDQQNKNLTWGTEYDMVLHCNDASGALQDSSGHGNHSTAQNLLTYLQPGKIFRSVYFPIAGFFNLFNWVEPASGSVEFWVRLISTAGAGHVFDGNVDATVIIAVAGGVFRVCFRASGGQAEFPLYTSDGAAPFNTWHRCILTWNADEVRFYLNGLSQLVRSPRLGSGLSPQSWYRFGGHAIHHPAHSVEGNAEELRFVSVHRNAAWVTTDYNNQNSPGTFYSLGSQEVQAIAVTTNAATLITKNTARLNGNLDGLGGESQVKVYFKYRKVGDPTWIVTDKETKSVIGAFHRDISGLSSGTNYEFKACASKIDDTGEVEGSVLTFTTLFIINGYVKLAGVGVTGAIVRVISQPDEVYIDDAITDSFGFFEISHSLLTNTKKYHVIVEYTSGGVKYNTKSLWDIVPV